MSENLTRRELLGLGTFVRQTEPPTRVTVAVIGAGGRGRELLATLSTVPSAAVKYVCDNYESVGFQKRAMENAPKATFVTDYKKVLDDPAVQGVFVATPTHLHKQIVLDALAAGKHVYCEAPLAHTIEEARVIAIAGRDAKTIFQAGLQNRTNGQHHHVKHFVEIGALGPVVRVEAAWNQKSSWQRTAPSPERETALNWRLDKNRANGLLGEVGIHAIDTVSWLLNKAPLSVVGFGEERSATVIFEYPEGVRLTYSATLGSSFGGSYELLCGDQSAILLRGERAWMVKEADAHSLGWEVYARKEQVGDEKAVILVANTSKLLSEGLQPSQAPRNPQHTPLYFACEAFLRSVRIGREKTDATPSITKTGEGWQKTDPLARDASAEIGFAATVIAIKAHEAVQTGKKITNLREESTLSLL